MPKYNVPESFVISDSPPSKSNDIFKQKDNYLFQCFAGFSLSLYGLSVGIALGWNSPTIPKLLASDSPIPITIDESSWISASYEVGLILIAIPGAWIMERFGRKVAVLLGVVPLVVNWFLIALADRVYLIYVARILSGFSIGMATIAIAPYVGEIALNNIRGRLIVWQLIMVKCGILFAYVVGNLLSIRDMAYICLISPCMFFFVVGIWIPESPYYLIGIDKHEQAFKSLSTFRGHQNIQVEFNSIIEMVKKSKENQAAFSDIFSCQANRKGFGIVFTIATAQMMCGSQIIVSYLHTIINNIGSGAETNNISIIFGIIQIITAVLCGTVVDKLGRRPLVLIACFGVTICNLVIGIYFLLKEYAIIDVQPIAWLPVLAILSFIFFYCLGISPIIITLMSEVLDKSIKGMVIASYTLYVAAVSFVMLKLFEIVTQGMGTYIPFLTFAVSTIACIPIVSNILPETKGKSFADILDILNNKQSKAGNL